MGSSIAKRTATAVKHQKSISEMVVQINQAIYDANNAEARCTKLRLKAGQLLLQLRQRIEAGEEGDVSWWEWFENLGNNGHPAALIRSRKDAERLMRIASAEDPEAALEVELAKDRERKRIARGADNGNVRSITRHVKGLCGSGDFVTVLEVEPEADQPSKRRSPAQMEWDKEVRYLTWLHDLLDHLPIPDHSNADLLSAKERARTIEIAENTIELAENKIVADLKKLVDRLRRRGRETA